MSLRLGALYDALLTAQGVSPEDAKKAAEEVAEYQHRIGAIASDLAILRWMVAVLIGLTFANVWLTVSILNRLPR